MPSVLWNLLCQINEVYIQSGNGNDNKWQINKTVNDDWAICHQYRVWVNMPSMMGTHTICNLRIRMPIKLVCYAKEMNVYTMANENIYATYCVWVIMVWQMKIYMPLTVCE